MKDAISIARALGDPIRYRIMQMLAQSETLCCSLPEEDGQPGAVCNCVLMKELDMIQSRVSYHMKELVEAGLVVEKPVGRWKFYSINYDTLREFLGQLKEGFNL